MIDSLKAGWSRLQVGISGAKLLEIVIRAFSIVGSSATIASWAIPMPGGPFKIFLLSLSILGLGILCFDGFCVWSTLPETYQSGDEQNINSYMCKWLTSGGRAAIFSRDLTWGNSPQTADTLKDKAKKQELVICVAAMNPFLEELQSLGADVHVRPHGFTPSVSFTIINFDKTTARVAIATQHSKSHVITEYDFRDHQPILSVATDLIKFGQLSSDAKTT